MLLKIKHTRKADHVHARVFIGPDAEHLALSGELIFSPVEWQCFSYALGQSGTACTISIERLPQSGCPRCSGCGQIANDDDGTPWKYWAELPPGSNLAVVMGLVKPIPCPNRGRKAPDPCPRPTKKGVSPAPARPASAPPVEECLAARSTARASRSA
jgi:hypothetical protein